MTADTAGWSAALLLGAHLLPRQPRAVLAAAGRPRSGVAHLYLGPVTPSGRYARASVRPLCGRSSRRLTILHTSTGVFAPVGRRACSNCSARLSSLAGRAEQITNRDELRSAFGHLTLLDLVNVTEVAASVDETYRVGLLAQLLFGPVPARLSTSLSPERTQRYFLHQRILKARRRLTIAERTPEERAQLIADRDAETRNHRQAQRAHRRAFAAARAMDRRDAGHYLTPAERELVST